MNRFSAQGAGARIDWELLPSLRSMLLARGQRGRPAWSDTLPSELDPPCPSTPFEEVMPGLEMREVREPEIFAFFFS